MIQFTNLPRLSWLIAGSVGLAALLLLSYWRAKGSSSRWLRVGLSGLRCLTVAVVAFCWFDPQWLETIRHQPAPRVAVLVDTSRSMDTKDVPAGRLGAVKDWWRNQVAPAIPTNFAVRYFGFDESVRPASSLEALQAEGNATALAGALERALALPGDEPLAGVVVCSDGIDNLSGDVERVARTYRRRGIPIHAVLSGATNDVRDIVVENVQVKRAAPNQAPTKVTVTLRAPGFRNQTVPVQVLQENHVVSLQGVALNGGTQKVELDFTPRRKGFQVFEINIPPQPGEWLAANNRRVFGVEVIDPAIRVLYMEGTPHQSGSPVPEWKYLKDALESDHDIKVKVLYRQFGAGSKFRHTLEADPDTGESAYAVEHPTQGFPRTLAGLLEYDVVIHSDIRKESFSADQLRNMARLVEEFGGGFIMIGGNSAFGKGGYHRTVLDEIIPVAMQQENDSQARPIRLGVPPSAFTHPLIALGTTRAETELIWGRKFPTLYGCNLVDRAKPGAIVLGEDLGSRNANGPRLLMAVQSIGKGRSMAFTSDTTRTWGRDFETLWGERINPSLPLTEYNCDTRYYRQFWVNAIRWLAAARISRTNNPVTLELAQGYCLPKERVAARVKVRAPDLTAIDTAEVAISLAGAGQTNVVAKPRFDAASRSYVADVVPAGPGQFVVTATATLNGTRLGDDRQLLVSEATDREMADLRARPELMAGIARMSGGAFLSVGDGQGDSAAAIFKDTPPATLEYRRTPLWDKWGWLTAIVTLLTVEWGVRRWRGMA